jgi:hypothetical protein
MLTDTQLLGKILEGCVQDVSVSRTGDKVSRIEPTFSHASFSDLFDSEEIIPVVEDSVANGKLAVRTHNGPRTRRNCISQLRYR